MFYLGKASVQHAIWWGCLLLIRERILLIRESLLLICEFLLLIEVSTAGSKRHAVPAPICFRIWLAVLQALETCMHSHHKSENIKNLAQNVLGPERFGPGAF